MKRLLAAFLLGLMSLALDARPAKVGQSLPAWHRGELDIHLVNAGRGECTFIIMPDGTTLVVDAGEMIKYKNSKYANVAPKPDADTRPADVYARYMRHFLPKESRDSIDWFVLTHYHMDHMGTVEHNVRLGGEVADSLIEGVPALYERLPFRTLLDRSYPDYSKTVEVGGTTKELKFYSDFITSATSKGLKAERFAVGTSDQIVPVHKKDCCTIMNYAASGYAWDGSKVVFSGADRENAMSCAFLLSYGDFDWWTSGDNNQEALVKLTTDAIVASGRKVEAQKCLHHMSNPVPVEYEAEHMDPQVIVTTSFYDRTIQPHQDAIRAIADHHDLFFTNISPSIVATDPALYARAKDMNGHFVVRVCRGGHRYFVYKLRDTDFSYAVEAVYGPYECK